MKSIKLFLIVALATTVSICAGQSAACAQQEKQELPLVILLGDSIRVGYRDNVAKALAGKAEVWSPRENCKSSTYVLERLDTWLADKKPAIVHVNAGLHDLVLKRPGVTATDINQYKENVRKTVSAIASRGGVTVIWATTTPVNDRLNGETRAGKSKDAKRVAWRENDQVIKFNQAASAALTGMDVVIDDLYSAVHNMNDEDLYIADGVHFSLYGREFLGDVVSKCLLKELARIKNKEMENNSRVTGRENQAFK